MRGVSRGLCSLTRVLFASCTPLDGTISDGCFFVSTSVSASATARARFSAAVIGKNLSVTVSFRGGGGNKAAMAKIEEHMDVSNRGIRTKIVSGR